MVTPYELAPMLDSLVRVSRRDGSIALLAKPVLMALGLRVTNSHSLMVSEFLPSITINDTVTRAKIQSGEQSLLD